VGYQGVGGIQKGGWAYTKKLKKKKKKRTRNSLLFGFGVVVLV
jgi:hypothetical protein